MARAPGFLRPGNQLDPRGRTLLFFLRRTAGDFKPRSGHQHKPVLASFPRLRFGFPFLAIERKTSHVAGTRRFLWMTPIYLDYNATTPLDPAVVEAMLPYLRGNFGNPSSTHVLGKQAHDAVEQARARVAVLLGAAGPDEIVFTSGGTEASNHALKGSVFARLGGTGLTAFLGRLFGRSRPAHLVISSIEHPATAVPAEFLRRLGCRLTVVPVDRHGLVDPDDVARALDRDTVLVSIMHANNEVGTLQPIREISRHTRARGVLLHTDAAQSLGKVAVDVNDLGVDLLTVAGHKLYAPKGVGALFMRRGVKLESLLHGAGHEAGRRAGTENVPYVVGLGTACQLARDSLPDATARLKSLREALWERLRARLGERVVLNGHPEKRLPNTLNVSFVGHVGSELLEKVPEIAASTGSACHEGKVSQSPVLCAMGVPPQIGKGAVRLTVGRFSTEAEIDTAADLLTRAAG
jgi:cysteine desulfurase